MKYAVYPCGENLDLPSSGKPVALFENKQHAEQYGQNWWPTTYRVWELREPDFKEVAAKILDLVSHRVEDGTSLYPGQECREGFDTLLYGTDLDAAELLAEWFRESWHDRSEKNQPTS